MTEELRTSLNRVVTVDPEIMHGVPCFTGTRVPVQTLIDFLETGETISSFLDVYPSISREQVHAYLEIAQSLTVEQLTCGS